MKTPFFCSVAAQQADEDLIGTAGHYQTYVLLECPTPWPAIAFDSPAIPSALRQYIDAIAAKKTVRFLCINCETSELPAHTTLLIYEQNSASKDLRQHPDRASESDHFTNGYQGYEFHLANLEEAIPCLEAYWQGAKDSEKRPVLGQEIDQQDILICTHGMRDKCCARFGRPLFKGAKQMVDEGVLPNARVWKASHIGGHRFAPTAITLPDGRYYGRLSLLALQSIVTRQGSIEQLRAVYRGWGRLPKSLQLLERDLLLSHGWSWFNHSVSYRQLRSEVNKGETAIELSVQQTNDDVVSYRAKVVQDEQKTYWGKKSCDDTSPSKIVQYTVEECLEYC